MIKSKYLRITAIIALVFIFGSCSDEFLELENPNRVTDENLKSPSGIRQLEIGMYTRLADNYNYFWQLYMSHLPGEYEMKETTGEGPYHQEVWNLNIKPTNPFIGWLYSAFYASLNNANRIISYMEEGTGTVNELPEREFDLILGSAYYIRALNHFFLLHSWGRPFDGDDQWGIVLQTSIVSEQTDYQKGRSAPSVVYAQIEQDLINAKSRLPLTTGLTSDELGRPTRGSATALLGKVYLFQKKYQEAVEEFELFLSENPEKQLLPKFVDNFNGRSENGPESVFEIQFADISPDVRWAGGGPASHYQLYVGGHGMGRDNFGIPKVMVLREDDADVDPDDPRLFDVRDMRFSGTLYSHRRAPRVYVYHGDTIEHADSLFFTDPPIPVPRSNKHTYTPKKYISNLVSGSNAGGVGNDVSGLNQVVMRLSEVYLLHAEALAHINRVGEAADFLNMVMRRARGYYLDEECPYDFKGSSPDDFMTLLMEEKRKEFIGEQIRWYDVIRWGIAESEMARNPDRVAWVEKAACFPIPIREIANNPMIEQNPYY